MSIGQQDVEVVAGQDQQLAPGIGRAGRVGIVVQGAVVDVAVTFLVVHGDAPGDLVVDQCATTGYRRTLFAVVPYVGLRRKARLEGRVAGLDDHRTGQGVTALGGGLRAKEHFDLFDIPERHGAEGQ
ncbi:hypothetical protein D3C79_928230 [compost metagenome]